ncbi:hypothetical protein D3A95_13260 [Thermosynechococcus sichuanensis E542]|uniref:O-antigen ligase family protein n=1 Tax=Thermosynechococcus sichuanensis E542 TaxID=2016101 RepID=A0A7D6J0J0_9CYAN|nr:hypothetical protein [Thermosynechococcus vestitus]QLL29256.1 hypothetical protein D3A95_13260 [Thermosynechococcus vestitus E542]
MSNLYLPKEKAHSKKLKFFGFRNFILLTVLLFILFEVFQGLLRWLLLLIRLEPLIYLPRLSFFLLIFIIPLIKPKVNQKVLLITIFFALYTIWGIINLKNLVQALFGLWVLAPFLVGLWSSKLIDLRQQKTILIFLFFSASLGVLLNVLLTFPWSGLTIEIGGQVIEVSRQWTAFGVERYAGFSRASFNAASQTLVLAIYSTIFTEFKSLKVFVWLLSGFAIYLTNSKGCIFSWIVLTLFFITLIPVKEKRFFCLSWTIIAIILSLTMVILPISTLYTHYSIDYTNDLSLILLASFEDRLISVWPASFDLLNNLFYWLFGRGIGGIGAPQQYFESSRYLPADNLFVYLCVLFGLPIAILSLLSVILILIKTSKSMLYSKINKFKFCIILFILIYGNIVNILEEPVLALVFGLVLLDRKREGLC